MTNPAPLRARAALAALLLATTAATHAAPAFARPMTEVDLATLNRLDAPTVSPDGKWVAYQVTTTAPDTFQRSTGLFLLDLTRPGATPVAVADTAGKSEAAPAFAPDGALWYLSNESGSDQVWRIDPMAAGTSGAAVTAFATDVAGFRLSPDGAKLLVWGDMAVDCPTFGCDKDGNRSLPGPGTGRLYNDEDGFVRHWDHWETPGNHSRPFVLDITDGKAANGRAIAPALVGDSPSKPFGGAEEMAWSADSKSVFFTLRVADRDEPRSTNLDVYRAPADAATPPENLTAGNLATDTLPTPSPDGRWLAYTAMARAGYEADRQVLMLRDLASGKVRAVTQGWDRSVGSITWAADSKSMIVTAQDTLEHPAFRVDLAGRVTRLTDRGNIGTVVTLPRGGMVYTINSLAAPNDLVLADARGRTRALTAVNAEKLAGIDPVTIDKISFPGAGGQTVWGIVVKPANATGKLPIAFVVHGGPQSSFGNSWSFRWNPRTIASQGYGVVSIDFHGSTGYGQAFTDSINRDWGGKPLEDMKLGLAAAVAGDAQLDGANACALGASYGGYMMNWIAGNWPDRFKCLVTHAGVFDLRAMAFETEEQWFDEWDHGGPWWERVQPERWNPVNHVTKWQTPTLVIHGEKDFRIPYTQSLAAFSALQRRGIDSQLLVFPDENHWILKGKNSVQWHRTVFDWLGKHLKPAAK